MTESTAQPDDMVLLRALGLVESPGPGVLEAAREVLWSAVAAEMLAADPAGGTGRARPARTDGLRDDTRRRGADPGW